MADAGLTSPAGDSVSSASDSSGSPDSSLPIGPRSKASMRFAALAICIRWHADAGPDEAVPAELWNAFFQATSRLAEAKNNTLGGIGNSRAASNTNTRSALHLALAALARPLAGLSATDTNASPSTSSSSSSPSSSSISSLPSLLPGSQSPDLLHSITAQTDCAPCQQNQQSHDAVSVASTIAAARRTGNQVPRQATIQSLPNELLHDILALLKPHQASLWEASKVCHKWNAVATRILYKEAHIGSPTAISKFTALLAHSVVSNRTSVPYYRIVRKIVFEPCLQGSLDHPGSLPAIEGIENLRAIHSSLFRYLVHHRGPTPVAPLPAAAGDVPAPPAHSETSIPVPDSIFYLLSGLCTSLKEMEEQGVESVSRIADYLDRIRQSPASLSGSWKPIQPASTTLTLLIRACRRWLIGLPEWGGFGLSVDKAYLAIILLLESFEGEFRPVWHNVGSDVVRCIRPLVMAKCRTALSSISTALLLQVQFVTSSSQRLLDCYCMIYYSALRIARSLNVSKLLAIMEGRSPDAVDAITALQGRQASARPGVAANRPPIPGLVESDAEAGQGAGGQQDASTSTDDNEDEQDSDDSDDGDESDQIAPEQHPALLAPTDRSDEDDSVSQVELLLPDSSDNRDDAESGPSTSKGKGKAKEQQEAMPLPKPPSEKNRRAAHRIHEALAILFQRRLPASPSREAPPRLPPPVSATISISPTSPVSPASASSASGSASGSATGSASTEPTATASSQGSASSSAASPIPAEPVLAALPISTLRDALLTFPPTSINGEMVEHLHRITEMDYDLREPGGTELKLWVSWLNETIRWHTASKQMDPVKDLLRGSMHKIDQLRGVQRRYGLSFMD